MAEIHKIVEARGAFFANRVDTYAKRMGLNNAEVVEHLQGLAADLGEGAITGIIDQFVPAELHSSKMPPLKNYRRK